MEHVEKYTITGSETRQWGQFFYIDLDDLSRFIKDYFPDIMVDITLPISPKILIINPGQRLSWQYHDRRKEIWSIIKGPVKVVHSHDDVERFVRIYNSGNIVTIQNKERHRIVGLDEYVVVAELWMHIDVNHLSDENDIVHIQDDYHR